MDWKFYGLREDPFGLTPDNRYLYMGEPQQEVLATLRESIEGNRGFVAVVSPPGIGKTTLLFQLIDDLRNVAVTAFVFQTTFQPMDILRLLWKELGLESEQADLVKMHQQFADGLARVAAMGKQFVLIVDEAQNLSPEAMETIRLLANFESQRKKMVQIVFAGHPELETLLARPGLEHIRQRIAAFCRLKPLTVEQTRDYLDHRLKVAGRADGSIFTDDAIAELADLSKGIPRTINIYAFQAMSKGWKAKAPVIDGSLMRQAIHQFEGWEDVQVAAPTVEDLTTATESSNDLINSEEELKSLLANVRADLERAGLQAATSNPPLTLQPAPARERTAAAAAPAPAPSLVASDGTSAKEVRPEPREATSDKIAVMPGKPRVVPPTFAAVDKPASGRPKWRLITLIALLVITIGTAGAWYWFRMRTRIPAPVVAQQPVATFPIAPTTIDTQSATTASNAATTTAHSAPAETTEKAATEPAVPAKTPAKQPVVEAREIAADAAPRRNATAPDVPNLTLSLGVGSTPNLGTALNASSSTAVVEHSAVLQAPKPMDVIRPYYPPAARQRGIQGTVILRVKVNAGGQPTDIKVVSGNPILAVAAQSAVRAAKFYPATSDGAPIAGETEIKLNFNPYTPR